MRHFVGAGQGRTARRIPKRQEIEGVRHDADETAARAGTGPGRRRRGRLGGMSPAGLGLDVGGATLRAAHTAGPAVSRPFALWKEPAALAGRLRDLTREFPPFGRLAVTMTG